MAMSPSNIVRSVGATTPHLPDGSITEKAIYRAFIKAGYGPKKASRWIETYVREDVFYNIGYHDDLQCRTFHCAWWGE